MSSILERLGNPDPRMWIGASCASADPEAWFPEKGGSTREAKKVCQDCPLRQSCLDYALANGERFGVWGGASEQERRKMPGYTPRRSAGLTEVEATGTDPRCGTDAGTQAHYKAGEKPCRDCRAASTTYKRERRAAA